jgi:protein phosphatase 2C family protein 2/3
MEDAHTHILDSPADEGAAFFAVYDGHGGARVAQFASMHLHKRIIGNEHYGTFFFLFKFHNSCLENEDYHNAIKSGFLKLDEELKQDEETKEQMSGTTAVTVLIKDRKIYCGWSYVRIFLHQPTI